RLVIDDRTVDRTFSYDDLSLSLDKSLGATHFSLAATGASRRWTATATAKGAPGDRRTFDVQLRDLSLDEIALVGGFRNLKFGRAGRDQGGGRPSDFQGIGGPAV
ncbi:MAG: hypothetical protein HYZ60_03365, partial [Methylocystis sp.]|nr:hypothetical protein [Methylocystis sp.]